MAEAKARTGLVAKLLLATASFALVFAVGEWMARTLLVQSDNFAFTLAAQAWHDRYWGPLNRFGMRDAEVDPVRLMRTRRLFVVGDSFAAGHGIEDRADRFADRLGRALGPDWSMVLLARSGWNSHQQLGALERFPVKPHVLVLAYYPNDIEGAAAAHGRKFEVTIEPAAWLAPVVGRSYLANWVYWRARRLAYAQELGSYWDFAAECFDDPAIWGRHREQLLAIVRFARENGTRLVVVAIPNLVDLEGSDRVMRRPVAAFREAGVEVLDLRVELAGRPPSELIVNPMDGHANTEVHRLIAERVLEILGPNPAAGR